MSTLPTGTAAPSIPRFLHRAVARAAVSLLPPRVRAWLQLGRHYDLKLRDRVHAHFGNQLVYSCVAGSAQNTEEAEYKAASGPEPKMFFAPIQMRKRNVDWGSGGVSRGAGRGSGRATARNPSKVSITLR